jgi:hypothetical protein
MTRAAESLWTDRVAIGADCIHCFTSAAGVNLPQNSMDVIPHRKLRKIQAGSDFLICEPSGDQSDQLLLAQSKIRP